jgi:hypothetical protein
VGRVVALVFFGIIGLAACSGQWSLLWLDGWIALGALVWFVIVSNGPYSRS